MKRVGLPTARFLQGCFHVTDVLTRFLKIGEDGQIKRVGYFLPNAGSTSAAYWVTNRIVYAVEYTRGIDILRSALGGRREL
jgi:hypothetical protein